VECAQLRPPRPLRGASTHPQRAETWV